MQRLFENNVAEVGKDTAPVTVSATDTPESPVEEEKTGDFVNVQGAETEADGTKRMRPRVTRPRVTRPRVTRPRVTRPRVTRPRVTRSPRSRATRPRATRPRAMRPRATRPRATRPRARTRGQEREPKSEPEPEPEPDESPKSQDEAPKDEAYGEGGEVKVDDTKQDAAVAADSTSAGAETKNDSPGEGRLMPPRRCRIGGGDGGVEANERSDVDEYVEEDEPASVEVERHQDRAVDFSTRVVPRAKLGRATADVEDELSNVYSSMTLQRRRSDFVHRDQAERSNTRAKLGDSDRGAGRHADQSSENLIEVEALYRHSHRHLGVDRDATNAICSGLARLRSTT